MLSWNAIIFGDLHFPVGAVGAWRRCTVDGGTRTVDELLDCFGEFNELAGEEFLTFALEPARVELRAWLLAHSFTSCRVQLAAMVRTAAELGAVGEIVFASSAQPNHAYRLIARDGQSRLEEIRDTAPGFDHPMVLDIAHAADRRAQRGEITLDEFLARYEDPTLSSPHDDGARPAPALQR